MQYLDKDNYETLINIRKLNKHIDILSLEIKDYNIKKENNIYFLNIQNNLFNKLFNKKDSLLKKYNSKIIKNAINIYNNKNKNNELIELIQTNNTKIINYSSTKFILSSIVDNIHNKLYNKYKLTIQNCKLYLLNNIKSLEINKFKKKFNSSILIIDNSSNNSNNNSNNNNSITIIDIKSKTYNFLNYINEFHFNLEILTFKSYIDIIIYFLQIYVVNIEFKYYIKERNIKNKIVFKLINNNTKYNKIINKNIKNNELLLKRSEDIKNKYNYIQNYIQIQEKKKIKIQFNFIKNIHELNIRLELNNELLVKYKDQLNNLHNILKNNDIIKGMKINNSDSCMICLEDIKYGIITKCNHNFHHSCINLYIFNILNLQDKIEIKCPICRQFI
jgi:hypothetical protein